eukprot:s3379_g5.t2
MAPESANELLRRIEGLQEELRVVSDRLVKLETSGIHQELRNKDFVYHSSPQLGPIMVMDTKPFDIQGGSWQPGIRSLVEEVVTRYDPKDLDTGYWRSHLGDRKVVAQTAPKRLKQIFTAATKLTAVTAPDDNLVYGNSCEDQLPSELLTLTRRECRYWPRFLTSEAQRFCDDTRFPLVRMACPETCGCTAVDSGMFMDTGCRQKCQNQPAFKASRENASCLDFSTTYFNDTRSAAWARYMRDWDRLLWSMAPNMRTMKEMSELFSVLEFVDCAFLQEIDMLDLLMCKPDPVEMFGGDSKSAVNHASQGNQISAEELDHEEMPRRSSETRGPWANGCPATAGQPTSSVQTPSLQL